MLRPSFLLPALTLEGPLSPAVWASLVLPTPRLAC